MHLIHSVIGDDIEQFIEHVIRLMLTTVTLLLLQT